jgi:hypothetical protein
VDPAAIGLGFEALVQVTLDRGDARTVAFDAAVSELPQIRQAERLFGDPDYLLRVRRVCSSSGRSCELLVRVEEVTEIMLI